MLKGEGIIIKNNYLYAFNFAPTIESHRENLKDGDGFEIRYKKQYNKLTQEQKNELQQEFYEDPETFNKWVKITELEFGRNRDSIRFALTRKPNDRNDILDKGQLRKETRQRRYNRESIRNFRENTGLVGAINVEESKDFGQETK